MKLCKYYSLDECKNITQVLKKLKSLQDDARIEYYIIDSDVLKIRDIGLTVKDKKDIIQFFFENDLVDYPDYEEDIYEEDDEDEEEEDEYEY